MSAGYKFMVLSDGRTLLLQYSHWRIQLDTRTGDGVFAFNLDAQFGFSSEPPARLKLAVHKSLQRAVEGPGPMMEATEQGMVAASREAEAIVWEYLETGEINE